MVTIKDPFSVLNLNQFEIYLMLTPEENARYGDKLKEIKDYPTLTKGIFHFDIVEKGDTPYDKLPDEMIRNMSHFNVMVRLVNYVHGIFCYGMEEVDFTGDKSSIVEQLEEFVKNVCKENIDLLDILSQRPTFTSREAILYYREHKIVKELFEAALKGETVDKDNGKSTLQSVSNSTDKKTSLGLVKFASSSRIDILDSKTERELRQNIKPESHPCIKITVKKVKAGKERKDGSQKEKIGVELNIDGNILPVTFVSTDQTFLYIVNLMIFKEGRYIERSPKLALSPVGIKELKGLDIVKRLELQKNWLHDRYQALNFSKDFEAWYDGVKDDPHRLDVAISGIKRTLWKKLEDYNCKDAFYYCALRNEEGIYKIRMNKENIYIDPKILERFSQG